MRIFGTVRVGAGLVRLALGPIIYSVVCVAASCSYVPFGALSALSGVDLLRVEAGELRVAVVSSEAIRFAGPPQLVLETVVPDRSTVVTRIMFVEADKGDVKGAPVDDLNRRVQIYKPDPAQAALWRDFQDGVRALKAAGVHGRVDASVDAKVCRGTPGHPLRTLTST